MNTIVTSKAEPVPSASQLAVLPFLAGLEGALRSDNSRPNCRLTIHRVMYRGIEVYLQQICDYVGSGSGGAGRIFPVTTGIIGAAFESATVFHTRSFESEDEARQTLINDMKQTKDTKLPAQVGISFIAVPFLGATGMPVLVLYGESVQLNLFSPERVRLLVDACQGFCRVFDRLSEKGFNGLKNFPLIEPESPKYMRDGRTVYPMQIKSPLAPPQFERLFSFNFEAQG
jgi:hypothetical protein